MALHESLSAEARDRSTVNELRFDRVCMSDTVWDALLAAKKSGKPPQAPPAGWSAGEAAAWTLYAPLLEGAGEAGFVFAQIGQSLDGRVATAAGDARDVSGRSGLEHLHRCRALAEAVIIGVETALQDDPQLTVRLASGDSPARVVIDPGCRLGDDAALLRDDGIRRLIVQAGDRPRPDGVEVVRLEAVDGRLDPRAIVAALADLGLRRLLVEGGAITIGRFFDAGLLARLHVGMSPVIIGAGPNGLVTAPLARLADAARPSTRVFGLGSDMIVDCALDQPGGSARMSTCPTTQTPANTCPARL